MINVGEYNKLKVSRKVDFGFYLTDEREKEVLLPNGSLNGNELEVGTSGTISENYYYFEVVKPAEKDAIKGVEYDSLGSHTATYIFKSDDGKMFIPVSVIITVDFTVGGEKYDCTSTVQFTNISDDKLPLPELDDKKDGDESSSESN